MIGRKETHSVHAVHNRLLSAKISTDIDQMKKRIFCVEEVYFIEM